MRTVSKLYPAVRAVDGRLTTGQLSLESVMFESCQQRYYSPVTVMHEHWVNGLIQWSDVLIRRIACYIKSV